MFGFLSAVFAFILTLFPLIMIHELGHYWMARLFGVHVQAFSIGYGPEIVGWTDKNGTRWKLAPFPLGGYVQILGEQEDDDAQGSVTSKIILQDREKTLSSKAPWQRILIAAAGPLSNYLTAFLLFLGLSMTSGSSIYEPILGPIKPNTLAEKAGLKEGDRLISVQGSLIKEFKEIFTVLEKSPSDKDLSFVVTRPGQEHPLILKVDAIKTQDADSDPNLSEEGPKKLGENIWRQKLQIVPSAYYKMDGKPLAFGEALGVTLNKIQLLSEMPLKMIKGGKLDSMSGPLGIAQQAQVAFGEGLQAILLFMGVLSVGLGLLNLLPIPMLDGGAILITLIEALLGKPLPARLHNVIVFSAIIFLGGLFLVFSWNDLMRILASL